MNIKCPVCNYSVAETAKFCPDCGAPLAKKNEKAKTGGKSNRTRDMIIIVGVLVVITAGYFVVKQPEAGPQPPMQQQQQQFGGSGHPEVDGDPGAMSVLSSLPTDYNSLIEIGNQTMDAGNYALAAECYRRALAIDGSSHNVRTDYGACLHGMGLEERALEEFRRVIKEHPEHSIANFNMGIVFYTMDDQHLDSAKYYWEKYLTIDPNGSAAESARSYLQRIKE